MSKNQHNESIEPSGVREREQSLGSMGFSGSEKSWLRIEKMIELWEQSRASDLEGFAEFAMTGTSRDLDEVLAKFYQSNDKDAHGAERR